MHRRRRGQVLVAAILEATLEELARSGYDATTVESIARTAGVGKASIYRRWASKADLAAEAVTYALDRASTPGTGHADGLGLERMPSRLGFVSTLADWIAWFASRDGCAVTACLMTTASDAASALMSASTFRLVLTLLRTSMATSIQADGDRGDIADLKAAHSLAELAVRAMLADAAHRQYDNDYPALLEVVVEIVGCTTEQLRT